MKPLFSSVSRREALKLGAILTAGTCTSSAIPVFARLAKTRPAFKSTLLSEFEYAQVDLAPGPLERQFEENHQLLLNLDEDSLLRPFRVRGGLPAPGEELGGWYSTYGFAPACPYGQWLSALSRMYSVTGDEATRAKIDRMVRGYAATIDPSGKFYRDYRFPGYIYDKLVCGLTEAHLYANHPIALDVLRQATDAVLPYLPPKAMPHQETPLVAREDFTRHVWDETYTMPENLFLAWQRTGTERYFELANRFLFNEEFFDPLARGENVLPGRHAYSHMNALGSAAMAYLALDDEKYLRTAKNAFAMVQQQSYATGGWGPHEHFITPGSGQLGESLNKDHASFETPCGAYAHFKLARHLMCITADSRYGDSMERVLYNTVLGAKPIQPDGSSFYYSDYTFRARKVFHGSKWPCCSGTMPQIAADYRISAFFRGRTGVYVNLYAPSTLRWNHSGSRCSMRVTTDYPYSSHIRLDLAASSPAELSVFLRIPEWASRASLAVNGKRDTRDLAPGAFFEVRRSWKTGDSIDLELPFTSHLEAVDAQHPNTVALVSGPLVLMAVDKENQAARSRPVLRSALLSAKQTSAGAHQWTGGVGVDGLILKPFPDIQDEGYTTYLNLI